MKRVRLAVLFLIAATLAAGTSADARGLGPVKLKSTGAEPSASGEWKLAHIQGVAGACSTADLTITCKGLTPGTTYSFLIWDDGNWQWFGGVAGWGSFTTTKKGTGQVTLWIGFRGGIEIWVTNAEGVEVLTTWGL